MRLLFCFLRHPIRTWQFVDFCVSVVVAEMQSERSVVEQLQRFSADN